jgi:hypothetical protein
MPKLTLSQFIRLSGWGLVLGGIFLLLTFLSDDQILIISRTFNAPPATTEMRFLAAILLITLGLGGLRARYGKRAGTTAKLALGVGVLGGAAGVISNLLWTMGSENGRPLMNSSMAVMFAGLAIFGLVALRTRPMPRGNALPALAGFWWPLIWIHAYVNHALGRLGPEVPAWLSFALFFSMSFFLAWLGYVLQSDAPPERAVA